MHYPYCLVLTLVLFLFSCAEEVGDAEPIPELPQDVPALEAMLRSDIGAATRLEVYYRLVWRLKADNPNRAERYAAQLLELATENGDGLFQGKAHHLKGLLYTSKYNYVDAVKQYLQAIEALGTVNSYGRLGDCYNNIGDILGKAGAYAEAVPYFEKASEYYAVANDPTYQMNALKSLAFYHWKKEAPDYRAGEEVYTRLIGMAREEKSYSPLVTIYNDYGFMKFVQGDYTGAIENYEIALGYAKDTGGKDVYRVMLYSNLAEAYFHKGKAHYAVSKEYIGKVLALEGIEPSQNRFKIQILNIQGEMYHRLGDHERAIAVLRRSIAIADRGIVNGPLKETLALLREAQRSYRVRGGRLAIEDSWQIEDLAAEQAALERAVRGGLAEAELQGRLLRAIEDHEDGIQKAEARVEQWGIYGILGICLLLALTALTYVLVRYRQEITRRNTFYQGMKGLLDF